MPSQATRHIKTTVGSNIRAARVAKNWTQRELAQSLDMDSMGVSRWERGKVMPSFETLARLAEQLDVTFDWLLVDHDTAGRAA